MFLVIVGSDGKESACNAGDPGFNLGLETSPGEGNENPLQYSCLENSMDRGAWWATVPGVTKSQTQLSNWAPTQVGMEGEDWILVSWDIQRWLQCQSYWRSVLGVACKVWRSVAVSWSHEGLQGCPGNSDFPEPTLAQAFPHPRSAFPCFWNQSLSRKPFLPWNTWSWLLLCSAFPEHSC